jgi:hypothetical protein
MTTDARSATVMPHTFPLFNDPSLQYARVEAPGDEPRPEPGLLEVAVLDMNHGWPNLGHSSIVETLAGIANDARAAIGPSAPAFRVVSYDVRGRGGMPSDPKRYPLIVGTGGPGAVDPHQNDGVSEGTQGIVDDPAWEAPLHRLFDAVAADERLSLLAICHSFGLLMRWHGFATPVLRASGKSAGVVTNVLTEKAHEHPWFHRLWEAAGGERIDVLDSRLYDLVPTGRNGATALAHEAAGEAVTMVEIARSRDGSRPRMWGVNHHPEIGDRGRQKERLARLEARGEVSREWVKERRAAMEAWNASAATEKRLQSTAEYTFEAPVREIISRAMAERTGLD